MEFNELVSPSLKELFIKEITENILSGKLKVGERLPNERELSEKMRVSRAVVNGGFVELERRGFLRILPRRGAFVSDYKRRGSIATIKAILEYNSGCFDPVMLESIYEVRVNTERQVLPLAAKNRTEKDIADLKKQMEIISKENSLRRMLEADKELYRLVFVATGNFFYPLIADIYSIIFIPLIKILYQRQYKEVQLEQVRELIRYIEQRDAGKAAECAVAIALEELKALSCHSHPGEPFRSRGKE